MQFSSYWSTEEEKHVLNTDIKHFQVFSSFFFPAMQEKESYYA